MPVFLDRTMGGRRLEGRGPSSISVGWFSVLVYVAAHIAELRA
jgi:hypothetical protein